MIFGIVGAMDEEIAELKSIMDDISEKRIGTLSFYVGKIHGQNVVLTKSGIGKVNAALTTTLLIRDFRVNKVIFTGVAGAVNENVNVTDIVIGTELIETDFDAKGNYDLGVIPAMDNSIFKSDEELFKIAGESAVEIFGEKKVFTGRISTRDEFVSDIKQVKFLREKFDVYCTEMEGAALAHVCYLLNTPFVVIRSMSDSADHNADMNFNEFVHIAAKNAKCIVELMLKKLGD